MTLPPSGWINAAHRQGSKIIGTLIFEHAEGEEDCLRLLLGPVSTKSGQKPPHIKSLPISPYYAKVLAALARERGFDGYLLNFECPFRGGPDQMRSLCGWIEIFRVELKREIGDHAELIWYDSVVITGQLAWQDRLNHYNLPFFVPSTGFFTNYTWRPTYPSLMSHYFSKLPPTTHRSKTLSSIFIGIDVWGRGQHGGGMLNSYKALSHIYPSPPALGTAVRGNEYAVALFGQAWSWESIRDQEKMDWSTWFQFELKFWLGEPLSLVSSRPALRRDIGIPSPNPKKPPPLCDCDDRPYAPLASFFSPRGRPAPDPMQIPLWTTFSPGVGDAWFVEGVKVHDGRWTDVDKQTSLGDLVWPDPRVYCEDVDMRDIWHAEAGVEMGDGWMGGSSLGLRLKYAASASEGEEEGEEDSFFSLYIPVQSVGLTEGQAYDVQLVYKLLGVEDGVDTVDVGLTARRLGSEPGEEVDVTSIDSDAERPHGWSSIQGRIIIAPGEEAPETRSVVSLCHVGVQLSILSPSSSPLPISIFLGQLTIAPSKSAPVLLPMITSIDATPNAGQISSSGPTNELQPASDWVHIRWHTAHAFPTALNFVKPSGGPDDTRLAWPALVDLSRRPRFSYCNVYVEALGSAGKGEKNGGPEKGSVVGNGKGRVWLGTTGVDRARTDFWASSRDVRDRLGLEKLPARVDQSKSVQEPLNLASDSVNPGRIRVRFWVQGVTDHGKVMELEESCAGSSWVDVEL